MNRFLKLWQNLKSKISKRFLIVFSIIFIIFIFLIRGCSETGTNRIYRIGQDPTWYPFNLNGKERNLTAFADDLLASIAESEKINIEIRSINPYQLLEGLETGIFDGILTAIPPSPFQRDQFVYSDSFFPLGPVLIVPIESPIHSVSELNDKIVGVSIEFSLNFDMAKYPSLIIQRYENLTNALDDLLADKIDAVLMGALPANTYAKSTYKGKIRIVTNPLTQEGLRLMTINDSRGEALIKHFNQGLVALKKKGTYDLLIDKWALVNTNPEP